MNRDEIREALPDWVGGRLEPERAEAVERAVGRDDDLRTEADLLRALSEGRDTVPAGLRDEIVAAVTRDRKDTSNRGALRPPLRWTVPAWAVGTAAVLALALGTRMIVDRPNPGEGTDETDALAAVLEGGYTPWVADDGTVAGAPLLDGLSEEDLASLLEELGG